tara:strand:+ start:3351 stop:4682 length:1332 start_codon:yes stop_codon:yes gene_type:complete
MSAAKPSLYEILTIESNDKERTADLRLGTVSVDYYEDIFSPTITAKIRVINTGDSIAPKDDPIGPRQSIYHGLPLRGGERVVLKIKDRGVGKVGIDFSKEPSDYLYVSSITDVISDTQRESFTLHLVSREAITNETTRVVKKYPTTLPINESVKKILNDVLKTEKYDKSSIEKSQNKYGFLGNLRKPFTILVWLASKAVPVSSGDATAGFVFYQTQDGFNFKSIDQLISQKPKAEYVHSEVNESQIESNTRNNDFQITSYTTDKNQDLIEKLRLGTYASQRMFFDPLTFQFKTQVFQLDGYKEKIENLGNEVDLPPLNETSDKTLGETPTRILSSVIDRGTMEKEVSKDENADPSKYQAQAIMRYNVLFTQTVRMTVPCNTNLRAGDVIKCFFPKISRGDSSEFDRDQSGLYMIKELCHHFETDGSFTSMLLVRDTFGLYTGK